MTFHSRSVVDFGLFLTRVSDCLVSGSALRQAADLIRVQLGASAVAILVEDRFAAGHGTVVIAEDDEGAVDAGETREGLRLGMLIENAQHVSASRVSELDGTRYQLWIFRAYGAPAFDAEETSVCDMLVGQLCRGLELSARIGTSELERTLYSGVMDRLCVGVIMLDETGRLVRSSPKAEELLAARDGLQIQLGRLRATCAKEDRELQAAIKAAAPGAAPASRGLALTKLSGNRTLGVIVQPVQGAQRTGASHAPSVAIYLRDPEANADVEIDLVRQLFDLTPAEAAVARRLTEGLSLEAAACSLAISRNTARAHLRSIFSKSGITRQTELMRLMLNSAAVLGERRQVA